MGVRDDGVTELGECKWGPVTAAQLTRELARKAERFPNPQHTLRRHAFVRTWKGKAPDGVELHRLADIAL